MKQYAQQQNAQQKHVKYNDDNTTDTFTNACSDGNIKKEIIQGLDESARAPQKIP